MKKIMITLAVVACFAATVFAQLPTVDIPGTQVQRINSTIVDQEYVLHVKLPAGYDASSKKYPVAYLMDSQWDFPLLSSLYGEQYYDGFIPEMIIVGVTWGGVNPNPDSLRARDYTPNTEPRLPQSGGAAKFLSALREEIIPFVEMKYKTDKTDRTLMGCSLGGLFTLYALFTSDGLFNRYIATTPAYNWGNEALYQYEKTYFGKKATSPVKLFITMGEVERGLPGYEKMVKFMEDRHYPALQMKSRVLENTGHSGNKAEGYARGLQYVFERQSLNLSREVLAAYEGVYKTGAGNIVEIKEEDGALAIHFDAVNKYKLHAGSDHDFYTKSEFLNISFKRENGVVKGFDLNRYGGSVFVAKVKK